MLGAGAMTPKVQIDDLIKLGFVVVVPEYRLCPQVDLYEGPITDAMESFTWTKEVLPRLLERDAGVLIDPERVAAMGNSAGGCLALHMVSLNSAIWICDSHVVQGAAPQSAKAILALYPYIGYDNSFYSTPLPAFKDVPAIPEDFQNQIFEGPPVYRFPMVFLENHQPDLSLPRQAWMISQIRDGTLMKTINGGDDYTKVDPIYSFTEKYPPTCFIHGTADAMVSHDFSARAETALEELDVDTELLYVDGADHAFDMPLQADSALYKEYILRGLKFLAEHV